MTFPHSLRGPLHPDDVPPSQLSDWYRMSSCWRLWLPGTAFLLESSVNYHGLCLLLSLSWSPAAPILGKWNVVKAFICSNFSDSEIPPGSLLRASRGSPSLLSSALWRSFTQQCVQHLLSPPPPPRPNPCHILNNLAMPRGATPAWSPLVTQFEVSKLTAPFSKSGNRITCTFIFINS